MKQRNTCKSVCRALDINDSMRLVVDFPLWITTCLTLLIFTLFLPEVSAKYKNNYESANKRLYYLSLEGVGFPQQEGNIENADAEKLPNLRKAYERFDDYKQSRCKDDMLTCAKVFRYLVPLQEGGKEKLPILIKKGKRKKGIFHSESEEYYALLKDEGLQQKISAVLNLAKKGKSQENDRQAFKNNEKKQSRRVEATTRELLEEYDALRACIKKRYPKIAHNRLPSVEEF